MHFLKAHIKILLIVLVLLPTAGVAHAQFLNGTSGLMIAPSGDMNPSGTFMISNVWLDKHYLPPVLPWLQAYDTFGYSVSITFWSRLEIAYVLTLSNGSKLPDPPNNWYRVLNNQDRLFCAKFQLLKENEFSWNWVPAIAVGVVDPVTGGAQDYIGSGNLNEYSNNGFFNRYYVVASKHIQTFLGEFGLHAGYQYSIRKQNWPYTGPCGGINWRPKWVQNDWIKLNLIGEYDSHTFNAGLIASIYKDHFDLLAVWQNMQWFSFGVRYKLVLF